MASGSGLSAALARAFAAEGLRCVLAARRTEKLQALCDEIGATRIQCNSASVDSVNALFAQLDTLCNAPAVVVYNASARVRGPLVDLDPQAHATIGMGGDPDKLDKTIYDVLTRPNTPLSSVVFSTRTPGLSLAPCNVLLASAELEILLM